MLTLAEAVHEKKNAASFSNITFDLTSVPHSQYSIAIIIESQHIFFKVMKFDLLYRISLIMW